MEMADAFFRKIHTMFRKTLRYSYRCLFADEVWQCSMQHAVNVIALGLTFKVIGNAGHLEIVQSAMEEWALNFGKLTQKCKSILR